MLGGGISVTSTLGAGSEFTITLPMLPAAPSRTFEAGSMQSSQRTAPREPLPATHSATGKTVLLVEDSEAARVQLQEYLQETGCRILIARDGREALDILAATIPDAIILDLLLPGVDGYAVLKALREVDRTAHIPVLVVTALTISAEAQLTLKQRNVQQLIQKGNMNGNDLRVAVMMMLFPAADANGRMKRPPQVIEGKPVLLVVEDNADNMLTLKALLGDKYTVLEAVDGFAGVAMASKHIPNLIIMDIDLPGMDGIEAFAEIRKNPSLQHIPVISLTANAMASDRVRILAHGFDAYIAKPVEASKMFTIIKEALYG
jgi:CheY-like chemotaxis protein